MNTKHLLSGSAVILALGWFFWRKPTPEPPAPTRNAGRIAMPALVPIDSQSRTQVVNKTELQAQRAAFIDEHRLRIATFRPPLIQDQFVFTLNYAAVPRSCINGDIDLMRRHLKSNQNLIWTVENDEGKAAMPARTVNASQLQQSFRQTLRLPVGEKARYYKISLCSADGSGRCAGMPPVNFDELEARRDRNLDLKRALYFTQNFRVDGGGIRLFDSREFKDKDGYVALAKKWDDGDEAKEFLTNMVNEQKTMRSFPARIGKDSLEIRLYMRTNKGC